MAEKWHEIIMKKTEDVSKEYLKHYQSIRHDLPINVQKLNDNDISLHDTIIRSCNINEDKTISLTLDCSGSFHRFNVVDFLFVGVNDYMFPEDMENRWWLYEELYQVKHGFELRVALDNCSEFRIVAKDMLIDEHK